MYVFTEKIVISVLLLSIFSLGCSCGEPEKAVRAFDGNELYKNDLMISETNKIKSKIQKEDVNQKIISAANRKLKEYTSTKENKKVFARMLGVSEVSWVDNIRLGAPYEKREVLHKDLIDQDEIEMSDTQSLNTWVFPLVVADNYVSLLKVTLDDGEWKVVQIGPSSGSKYIGNVEKKLGTIDGIRKRAIITSYELDRSVCAYVKEDGVFTITKL
jgi:hypothetical protein